MNNESAGRAAAVRVPTPGAGSRIPQSAADIGRRVTLSNEQLGHSPGALSDDMPALTGFINTKWDYGR